MTLFGIDISNNQFGGPDNVNLSQIAPFMEAVAAAGYSWVEMKASQGSDFIDPYFYAVYAWCSANNFPLVAYHFLDTSPAESQAANCQNAIAGGVGTMLDFESGGGDWSNFQAVQGAFTSAGLKVVLSYVPQWYWNDIGSPNISVAPGLVSSAYPSTSGGYGSTLYEDGGGDSGEGWNSYGGGTPQIWQFTDNAVIDPAGQYSGVDANAFQGTLPELQILLGLEPTMTPAQEALLQQVHDQLCILWPELGERADGKSGRTVVDAIAHLLGDPNA